jgi:hypothetical protein
MKRKHFYLLSLAFMGLMTRANAQCTSWTSVGPTDTNQIEFGGGTSSTYNGIAVNPKNNNPYVVFRDANPPGGAYYGTSVREFVGGEWQYVGNGGFTAGEGKFNSITFDKNGNGYVACQDAGLTLHCAVYAYVGGVWDTLPGQKAGFTEPAQYISITTDTNGVPYVAYEDLLHAKLDVLMYNAGLGAWQPVGGSLGISPGQAQYESIAFDRVHNTPYVAFEDGSNNDKLMVYSFNGATWSTVGGASYTTGITTDTVNWVSLAIDKNGVPFVGYEDYSAGENVGLVTYNGTNWVEDTAKRVDELGGPVNYVSIGVDSIDNVYMSYQDLSSYGGEKLSIAEYTNSSGKWNFVGGSYKVSQGLSQGDAVYTSLAMNKGLPVVTYNDKGIGDHCEAFQYNSVSKNWVYLGSEGISNGSGLDWNGLAGNLSMAISPTSNMPYISYSDGNNKDKATVMSWSGSAWSLVGDSAFSLGEVKYTNIGFDNAGDPIACFSDEGATNKYGVSVMEYTGGAWTAIGTNANTISGKDCYYVSMAISSADTIYVTYQDYNYGIDVMKCAVGGTTWEQVGAVDFSGDTASEMSIAVDKNGVPYVAFIDNADTTGVTVMKYTAGAWTAVGVRGFSGGGCNYTAIQINPTNNMPAVSYDNWNASNEADVEQFNGTTWNFVGGSGISHDWASYTSLAIDKNGNYYTAYQDFGDEVSTEGYGNSTVEKFDASGTTWAFAPTVPSDGSASYGGAIDEVVAVDNNGVIYAGFVGYSAYVKKMDCPDLGLGVNDIAAPTTAQAIVYPNPSHGSFTVEMQNGTANSHVVIYNVLGENIYQAPLNTDKTQITLTNQSAGIYLYRILDENNQVVSTGKLIIER